MCPGVAIAEVVSRHRPVTAMQRQKEKEEKRHKKLEKAREKKKKKGKCQPSEFSSYLIELPATAMLIVRTCMYDIVTCMPSH